ncbi:MAG TPA: dUTP diphosphatase [Candidatus Riflebacteria bacterium]|jgi:dUTP pyrophosphatase|nr:dUTP diphosphatase [Candidatus Riflebacteria bacterium]
MHDNTCTPQIYVQLEDRPGVSIPVQATAGSAGYDLCACQQILLKARCYAKVPTGLRLSMPSGFEGQVRPRSGLAAKHGVTVLNAPGTIDSDYRGEVCVILINHGNEDFLIEPGMRVAQLVFARVITVDFVKTDSLDESGRGEGGFGSTGTR